MSGVDATRSATATRLGRTPASSIVLSKWSPSDKTRPASKRARLLSAKRFSVLTRLFCREVICSMSL